MRWLVAALTAAVVGCAERTSSADAARADSSAAGYAVGPRSATSPVAAVPGGTTSPADSQPAPPWLSY